MSKRFDVLRNLTFFMLIIYNSLEEDFKGAGRHGNLVYRFLEEGEGTSDWKTSSQFWRTVIRSEGSTAKTRKIRKFEVCLKERKIT